MDRGFFMRYCGLRKSFPLIEAIEDSMTEKVTFISAHDFKKDKTNR